MNLTDKQKNIVVSALKLISEGGLQHLTIKALASSLNISEGAIYRHFKSKDEILNAIADTFDDRYLKVNENIFKSNQSPIEKLKSIFFEKIKRLSEHPEQTAIIISNNLFRKHTSFSEQVNDTLQSYRKSIYSIITEGQNQNLIRKDIPPEHIYDLVIGSMHMFFTRWERLLYSFDLKTEGEKLWKSIYTAISYTYNNLKEKSND